MFILFLNEIYNENYKRTKICNNKKDKRNIRCTYTNII